MRIRLVSLGKSLGLVRSYTTDLAIILAFFVVGYLAVSHLLRDSIVLEISSVPKPLEEMGYTGQIVSYKLWDAALFINDEASTVKGRKSILADIGEPDIVAPGIGISLNDVVRMVRDLFGISETKVGAAFVCGDAQCKLEAMDLHIQVITAGRLTSTTVGALGTLRTQEDFDRYFDRAAIALIRLIDPYVVASFLYGADFGSPSPRAAQLANALLDPSRRIDETRTEAEAMRILRAGGEQSPWAANLLGVIELDQRARPARARHWFEKALDLAAFNKTAQVAGFLSNEGVALDRLGYRDEAFAKLRAAIRADPAWPVPYRNLGNLLMAEDPEAARKYYAYAVAVDPGFAEGYTAWAASLLPRSTAKGVLLSQQERTDLGRACDLYAQATKADPTLIRAHLGLAKCRAGLQSPGEARQAFAEAQSVAPRDASVLVAWANFEWGQDEREVAFEKLQEAALLDPRDPDTFTTWGSYASTIGDQSTADKMYSRAVRLRPYTAEALLKWGATLEDAGHDRRAMLRYRAAADRYPEDARSWVAMARISLREADRALQEGNRALQERNHALARTLYGAAIRNDAEAPRRKLDRLRDIWRDGFDDVAKAEFERMIADNPDDRTLPTALAALLWDDDRQEEALERYAAAASIRFGAEDREPEGADLGGERAGTEAGDGQKDALLEFAQHALDANSRRDEAMEALAAAADLDPEDADTRMRLANALADAGEIRAALRGNATALQIAPEEPMNWQWRADLQWRRGQREEALRGYANVVVLDGSADAVRGWIDHLWQAGQRDRARAAAENAVALHPSDAWPHSQLAWILFETGQIERSLDEATLATKIVASDSGASLTRAELLWRHRQFDAALAEFARAAEIDSEARLALADRLWLSGEATEAIQQYAAYVNDAVEMGDAWSAYWLADDLASSADGCRRAAAIEGSGLVSVWAYVAPYVAERCAELVLVAGGPR